MKITEIKFMARKNLGGYEHEEVTLTAVCDEYEKEFISDIMAELKVKAYQMFSFPTTGSMQTQEPVAVEETKPVEAPVKEKKAKKTKPVEEEKSASEKAADMMDGQEVPPVIPQETEEEMEVVESPYKKTAAPAPKQKTVAYDLKNKDHRDRLAAYLNKEHPTWKTQPKDKLLAFSNSLVGKEFEDLNGNMLDSFKEIVSATFA